MSGLINQAEAEYKADPERRRQNRHAYADALAKTEQTDYENKAIDVLQSAFERTKSVPLPAADRRASAWRRLTRMERTLRRAVQTPTPATPTPSRPAPSSASEKLQEELAEYRLAAENYPTDATLQVRRGRAGWSN